MFKKTWFQIIILGAVIGAVLIVVDNKFDLFGKKKKETDTYHGPISVDKDKAYFTQAVLNETVFDFGKVKEGDTLSHVFKITNNGKEPLFIFKSSGSCDCVGAAVTKDPIPPGKEVEVKAYFNTKGRKGPQSRTIELTCNTEPAQISISLKAMVE
jgi:hypothetical protein